MTSKWTGSKYNSKCCNTELQSKYSGQYVSCKCGKVAIDDTPYYTRTIGDPNLLELKLDSVPRDIEVYTGDEDEK